jgi:hypothetical protein
MDRIRCPPDEIKVIADRIRCPPGEIKASADRIYRPPGEIHPTPEHLNVFAGHFYMSRFEFNLPPIELDR